MGATTRQQKKKNRIVPKNVGRSGQFLHCRIRIHLGTSGKGKKGAGKGEKEGERRAIEEGGEVFDGCSEGPTSQGPTTSKGTRETRFTVMFFILRFAF